MVAPVISAKAPPLILLCHWWVIVAPSDWRSATNELTLKIVVGDEPAQIAAIAVFKVLFPETEFNLKLMVSSS